MRVFKTELQVRGYELDGYGHVNNAVYLNYAEHARWTMIEEATGGADYFKRHGVSPVVVRTEIDYRVPCFQAEWIFVETTTIEVRKRTATFKHLVKKKATGQLAAELVVTLVCVSPAGKAVVLPADFSKTFGADEP